VDYYYFVATLPALALGAPPPMSTDAFDALCGEYLDESDLNGLRELRAGFDGAPRHPFAREWDAAETCLRNAVAHSRAARLKRDATPCLRPQAAVDVFVEHGVQEAFMRPDPLERELALDRLRWQRAEELAGLDPFAGRAVLAYRVRLGLVERWDAMSEARGAARRDALVSATAGANTAETATEAS